MQIYLIQTFAPQVADSFHGQDMLLALATLELNPQLILQGDALLQIRTGNDQERHGKSLQKRYGLLALFDAPEPWVFAEDLAEMGLTVNDLVMDVVVKSATEVNELLAESSKVLRF
ncbi:DsrE family protein [Pseudidiomarina salilacus]|uniref:DsrE family protein n=1 Tax=Pseudidiomarina salilacus TaxID=3384452 RepID=UPI0039852B20